MMKVLSGKDNIPLLLTSSGSSFEGFSKDVFTTPTVSSTGILLDTTTKFKHFYNTVPDSFGCHLIKFFNVSFCGRVHDSLSLEVNNLVKVKADV